MKSFTYNGAKYINGYACDAHGRPITIKNGYSSEDEKEAHESYLEALELMKNNPIKNNSAQKYSTKTVIKQDIDAQLMAYYEAEYHNVRRRKQDGYMLNDAGEKISVENGYAEVDEKFSKRQAKNLSF